MSDLISRAALLDEYEWLKANTGAYNHAELDEHIERINNAPAVDAEPVRHGEWIDYLSDPYCSVCGRFADSKTDFCPNCGAKMYGEHVL